VGRLIGLRAGNRQQFLDSRDKLIFALVPWQQLEHLALGVQQDNRRNTCYPVPHRQIMRRRLIDVQHMEINPILVLHFKPSHGRAYGSADPSPPSMEFEKVRLSVILDHVQRGIRSQSRDRAGHWAGRCRWEGGHQDRRRSARCRAGNRSGCVGPNTDHRRRRGWQGGHRLDGSTPDVSARCCQEQLDTDKKAGEQDFPEQSLAFLSSPALAILVRFWPLACSACRIMSFKRGELPPQVRAGPGSTLPCRPAGRS
jgi:hypothetical protein